MNNQSLPRLLRRPEVEAITGLSRSSIYAQMEKGDFPKPVKLGPRAVAWPESRIEAWLAEKLEGVVDDDE